MIAHTGQRFPTLEAVLPLPFGDPVGPLTFPAFDGPASTRGIFPTDFSSTMPSADCPSAIGVPCGSLTASCDAHVCFPASPGSWCAASPPRHAEALVSRFASCPAFVLAEPGALPGYSRLLSVRNRWIYVMRRTGNWRTSGCVAPSSPCIPPTIHLRGVSSPAYSVRPACPPLDGGRGGQVGPHLRLRLPQGRLADETFAIGYPSPLPSWVRTLT